MSKLDLGRVDLLSMLGNSSSAGVDTAKGVIPFSTSGATWAVPRLSEDGITSHFLRRRGYVTMTQGGSRDQNAAVRKILSLIIAYDIQTQACFFISNEESMRITMAETMGVKDRPNARTNSWAEVSDSDINRGIAKALKEGNLTLDENQKDGFMKLVHAFVADILAQSGHYKPVTSVTYFSAPIDMESDYLDPFSIAIIRDVLDDSPFSELRYDARAMSELEDRDVPITRFSRVMAQMGNAMVRNIMVLNEAAQRKLRGLAVVGEIVHGRVRAPVRYLNDSFIQTLRSNINFHLLTRTTPERWAQSWIQAFGSLKGWVDAINGIADATTEEEKKKLAMQTSMDLELLSDLTPLIRDAATSVEKFVTFAPLSFYQGLGSVTQIRALDSSTNLAAVIVRYAAKEINLIPAYQSFQVPTVDVAVKKTAIMDQRLSLQLPEFSEDQFFGMLEQRMQNMSDSEVAELVDRIAKGETPFGDVVKQLPGTSTLLVTNGYYMGGLLTNEDKIIPGDASVPALLYMQAASFASSVRFPPGEYPVFHHESSNGDVRLTDQVSADAQLSHSAVETANPLNFLVACNVSVHTPSIAIDIIEPMPDLTRRGTTEYVHKGEIKVAAIPSLPPKSADRKAQVSRETAKFERVLYKARKGGAQVAAPIDLESLFGIAVNLAVPTVKHVYSPDSKTKLALDIIKGLESDGDKAAATRLLMTLARAYTGTYSSLALRRRDEITGIAAQPSDVAMQEFALQSGVQTLKAVAKHTGIMEVATIEMVEEKVRSLDDNRFYEIAAEVVLRALKGM
uniref:p1 n=1 Tax=Pseudomonas phage phi8 TaxID=120086 RepID=UPI000E6E5BFE|nr:Chain A, p1 [Pseudomonas phage phi8]4BTP_B Chain B, p1 [Pseudomonas phage phi8]4BTP_C Chain C, p1 [Pseudomonas phage phi8]4BTP_D Chain D, p1 [Pseudomonas phage phi8]4BTP_E Chain E, p1 [Pseudomonas phage phi8]4BTP_F Chain F, p1 [Pseudomonas phage phi8]4BTP_G Chain G, p1 [Pseudomonas phage phi8]4BTP_H Chain H, p1 [Pseudomonas phage phi8]4BTP_I Chain I, p1 [Pseudomonas phage phi8]4BTP_J Chain J, p1 [Pseudomonas phage phi8]